jgi:hypothetical protein
MNKCHCNFGWVGTDCSTPSYVTTTIPSITTAAADQIKMERKETPYGMYYYFSCRNISFTLSALQSIEKTFLKTRLGKFLKLGEKKISLSPTKKNLFI